ncbi:unnamed protein product [Spirodela intermedia]|uniref:Uncharacterized protein n=1 Tax=Spirodela intermedia TaxID=51605 RepID=A0A7I8LDV3_SPIIN|nr:unnamed protein product [Spirodela intermedia]
MFSPFRGRRVEEPGAGGKVLRSRRRAVSASPYARPENSPPPPVPQSGNPKWFSGIISGAGRLISSVFRSDSGESSSSSSSDADEGDRDSSDPRSQEGNGQEGIPAAMVSTNGSSLQPGVLLNPSSSFLRSSSNPWISASEEGHHFPPPSNGGEPAAASAELRQKNPPQNGTVMKSIEQMLSDNRPAARGGGRGRRVAVKSRRGRGRGK